ncbi:MAG: polysaccharide deacetylase family protein [Pseudomonadota bacterium]
MRTHHSPRRAAARLLAACWMALAAASAMAARPGFPWPGGAQAAVSLAYDDALDSQLDHAIPALDRVGLKGSFYLTLGASAVARRLPEWRAAAARGHELGNHTLFHQCAGSLPGREWVPPDADLDKTTATQIAAQVRLGNTMLQAIDGRTERTFTVPCGDIRAAGEDYIHLVAPEFLAIKLGSGGLVADMARLDLHAVPVDVPVGATGEQLIARVKEAARAGTMVSFTFHGIGGDHLSVSSEAHQALLRYLADHRAIYWTVPFVEIARHVKETRQRQGGTSHRQ